MSTERTVAVWDAPTRLFHWSLLALILVAWFTGEEEGTAAIIHRFAGETIAGLMVFRVLWGFIGGERSRFSDFAAGPSAIVAHVRDLMSSSPKRHLGHNPLGGVAVFMLLAVVALIVISGLFSEGEGGGPFAGLWGVELSDWHEPLFRVLQGLVLIHVLGVVVESWKARDALLPAMFTGRKRRRDDEPGADAKRAAPIALVIAVAAGVVSSALLMSQPASSADVGRIGDAASGHDERGEREHDD
jgi:cytochrome b